MVIAMATALSRVRALVAAATVNGATLEAVYAESETDANQIPAALTFGTTPVACVYLGNSDPEKTFLMGGQQRRSYEIEIWLYAPMGGLDGWSASLVHWVDALCELFVSNVTLGSRVNYAIFDRFEGFNLAYASGSVEYAVKKIVLRVSEQSTATPAPGA